MVVLSVEHAQPQIEGYLCRHLYKIRPGVFVGRISASRRQALWDHILSVQPDIDMVMAYDDSHKRVAFQTSGNPQRTVVTEDGLQLLAFKHAEDETWKEIPGKKANHLGFQKSLWEHLYETGELSYLLLTRSAYDSVADILRQQTDCTDKQELVNTLCFFAAMHDIGKIHPAFQKKLDGVKNGFRHEGYSRWILRQFLKEQGISARHGNYSSMYKLCDVIGDHHQNHVADDISVYKEQYQSDRQIIQDFVAFINQYFKVTPFNITSDENLFCQLFSGIVRFSDWGASTFSDEVYCDGNVDNYMQNVQDRCLKYLGDGQILKKEKFQTSYTYHELFPFLTEDNLRPLQTMTESVLQERSCPLCTLIEDETGSGKTEAAVYLAMNIMAVSNKQGIYFALPTGATSEAMLPRLESLQQQGFFSGIDLRLLTGFAWMTDIDEDSSDKANWTKTGARKLFAPFACGTVDQLMAAVEALKASDMRLLALSNKVVIIDEFHAYDAWMEDILLKLLTWLKAMNVPVIILSATLRNSTRENIFKIYAHDVSSCSQPGYPRITVADANSMCTYFPPVTSKKSYNVVVDNEANVVPEILKSVDTGGTTLCIMNTVDQARELYSQLNNEKSGDTFLTLYTARTTPENKEKLGKKLVYLYGKQGKAEHKRPTKSIVISTQICEMSMDVDFDTVFSEIAPVDTLFQRLGRMRRHEDAGTVREQGFKSVFHIIIPTQQGTWYLPYNESLMRATLGYVHPKTVTIPDDVQTDIEESYTLAGKAWIGEEKRLMIKAKGSGIEFGNPCDGYTVNKNLRTNAITRNETYQTIDLILLPENETIQDNKQWCINMIQKHSVNISTDLFQKMNCKVIDNIKKPVWIRDYTLIRDKATYWGPDGVFIGNSTENQRF